MRAALAAEGMINSVSISELKVEWRATLHRRSAPLVWSKLALEISFTMVLVFVGREESFATALESLKS